MRRSGWPGKRCDFEADSDIDAVSTAKQWRDGNAIEVWCGPILIDHQTNAQARAFCRSKASLPRAIDGCAQFFTFNQCFDRPGSVKCKQVKDTQLSTTLEAASRRLIPSTTAVPSPRREQARR